MHAAKAGLYVLLIKKMMTGIDSVPDHSVKK